MYPRQYKTVNKCPEFIIGLQNLAEYSLSGSFETKLVLLWGFRKTEVSYKELNERKERVRKLEKLYSEMALRKELQVFAIKYFTLL